MPGDKEHAQPPVPEHPRDAMLSHRGHASPSVRRFARELGVDILQVKGSAPKGRVTKDDVRSHVKRILAGGESRQSSGPLRLPALPEVDFAAYGEIEHQPLGRIKKLSGGHLQGCWLNIPHVTQFDEADISELEAFRKSLKEEAARQEIRLTPMPFIMKACVAALKAMPDFNSSLDSDGENLIIKHYYHLGVAVDTPKGLVVPVIRNVDQKSVYDLARELGEISEKARKGKLSPDDMRGGTFTISSLGGIGGTGFTPIVNAPEVAILGLSRSKMQPVWNGKEFEPRLILPFSVSYDHRVIDGAQGVRFTTLLAKLLGDIRRLML
jgi:pyruvate dehydrogenase E2 component (dihydrolipoamide acetyltransferase)